MKKVLIIIFCFSMISCGNKKPNKLPDGVIDKSTYPFPPNEEYHYPNDTSCLLNYYKNFQLLFISMLTLSSLIQFSFLFL